MKILIIKYFGLFGSLLILLGGFLPIASINEEMIVILPFFITTGDISGIWSWRDISAFALTYGILSILSPYFVINGKKTGIIITTSLTIICLIFILISLWMAGLKIEQIDALSLNFSLNWIVITLGLILQILSVIKIPHLNKSK